MLGVCWDQTGIQVLHRSGLSGVFVYNATDGAASSILDLDGYYPLIHDWSGDGSKIAYSNSRCVEGVGLFSCDVSEWVLRVVDIERRRDQSAAVIHSIYSERGTNPGFSPDGNRIAYVFDGRIYLTDSLQD